MSEVSRIGNILNKGRILTENDPDSYCQFAINKFPTNNVSDERFGRNAFCTGSKKKSALKCDLTGVVVMARGLSGSFRLDYRNCA